MACLVDTDVMIDVSRGHEAAADLIDSLEIPAISIVTAHELIVGARGKKDLAAIDGFVALFPIIHLDAAIGQLAYDLLKRHAGADGLRTFDSLIAATAIHHGMELVSRNRRHFAMINGLRFSSPSY